MKSFKIKTKFIDQFGKGTCNVKLKPLNLKLITEFKAVWLSLESRDQLGASHDGMFVVNRDAALAFAAYFKELAKELK